MEKTITFETKHDAFAHLEETIREMRNIIIDNNQDKYNSVKYNFNSIRKEDLDKFYPLGKIVNNDDGFYLNFEYNDTYKSYYRAENGLFKNIDKKLSFKIEYNKDLNHYVFTEKDFSVNVKPEFLRDFLVHFSKIEMNNPVGLGKILFKTLMGTFLGKLGFDKIQKDILKDTKMFLVMNTRKILNTLSENVKKGIVEEKEFGWSVDFKRFVDTDSFMTQKNVDDTVLLNLYHNRSYEHDGKTDFLLKVKLDKGKAIINFFEENKNENGFELVKFETISVAATTEAIKKEIANIARERTNVVAKKTLKRLKEEIKNTAQRMQM